MVTVLADYTSATQRYYTALHNLRKTVLEHYFVSIRTQGLERPPYYFQTRNSSVFRSLFSSYCIFIKPFFFAFTTENVATNIPVLAFHSDAFPVGRDKNKIPKKFLVVII